ncbi:MAG: rRNA maturation RNase YbeY [Spirochaetales bacterium]|nr:rRNA maturation RNase YbeY [Spirochaetales bacterium]
MNNIEISCYDVKEQIWFERAEIYCRKVLEYLEKEKWEISLVFTNNAYIRGLNRDFREKDTPTDVLSFCQSDGDIPVPVNSESFYAGDIIISLEYLDRNCTEFQVSRDEELRRLILHGILHLAGFDHATNDPGEKMLIFQEEILNKIGEVIL